MNSQLDHAHKSPMPDNNDRFHTGDPLSVWDKPGQSTLVRLVMLLVVRQV